MSEVERELSRLKKDKRQFEKKGNLKEVATVCNALGDLYAKAGQYEDAIKEHELELSLGEAFEDTLGCAIANRKIGECLCEQGEFSRALQHQRHYLELAQKAKSNKEIQRAYATIGRTYLIMGDSSSTEKEKKTALRQAERCIQQSLGETDQLRSRGEVQEKEYTAMKARLLLNLGLVFAGQGDPSQACNFMKKSVELSQKYGFSDLLSQCCSTLADLYLQQGDLEQAVSAINKAVSAAQQAKDKASQMEALTLKAQIQIHQADYGGAKKSLRKVYKCRDTPRGVMETAKKLIKCAHTLSEVNAELPETGDWNTKAKLYEKMGDAAAGASLFKPAITFYHKMLKCAKTSGKAGPELIDIYVSLSITYQDDKQYEKAVQYFHKELEQRDQDHEQACRTWFNIAMAQEQQGVSYEDIQHSYKQAHKRATQANIVRLQVRSLRYLWILQGDKGKTEEQAETQRHLLEKHGVDPQIEVNEDEEESQPMEDEEDAEDVTAAEQDWQTMLGSDSSSEEEEENSGMKVSVEGRRSRAGGRQMFRFKKNEKGESPLHVACIQGNLKRVRTLLQQGHPVNLRDNCGWLPLHEACNHGYLDIVECLLDHGAHMNDRGGQGCDGLTPLHDACQGGHASIVKLLVHRGANVHAKTDMGETAYDCLEQYGERCEDMSREETIEWKETLKLLWKLQTGNNPHSPPMPVQRRKEKTRHRDSEEDHPSIRHVSRRGQRLKSPRRQSSRVVESDHDDIFTSDSDSESEVPSSAPVNRRPLDNPDAARSAYLDAMSSIGSSATRRSYTQHSPAKKTKTPVRRPALLAAEEEVGDDWLIDDLRPGKRKRMDVNGVFSTNSSKRSKSDKRTSGMQSRSGLISDDDSDSENTNLHNLSGVHGNDFADIDDDIGTLASLESENSDLSLPTISHPKSKRKTQLKLDKYRTANMSTAQDTANSSTPTADSNTDVSVIADTQARDNHSTDTGLLQRVMVKISEISDIKLVVPLIPSEAPHTVAWLCRAAADRYKQLKGQEPLLSLKTSYGAILSPDDMVSHLLKNDDVVEGLVQGWDMDPPGDRYVEICKRLRKVPYKNIVTVLQDSERSQKIQLNDLALHSVHFIPVAKALHCQSSLRELHLQGNRLGDESAEVLGDCLAALPCLQVLDISCNNVTGQGLRTLTDKLKNEGSDNKPLQMLERLALGYNPLTDSCSLSLARILELLAALTALRLDHCQFTAKLFQDHRLALTSALKGLNISQLSLAHNKLGSMGVELLLLCINPASLLQLNLSGCVSINSSNHLLKHLQKFTSTATCSLQEINLSSCLLTSEHMEDLDGFIRSTSSLVRMNLSCNRLTNSDLIRALTTSANLNKNCLEHLEFTGCLVKSPLDCGFLDALSAKLDHETPLKQVAFDCEGLDKMDQDSLTQVWQEKWGSKSQCRYKRNRAVLTVLDSGN